MRLDNSLGTATVEQGSDSWDSVYTSWAVILLAMRKDPAEFITGLKLALDQQKHAATFTTKVEHDYYHLMLPNIVSLWHQRPEFCDKLGEPLELPLTGPTPSLESLTRLAETVSKIAPNSVPVEGIEKQLLENGAMTKTDSGRYKSVRADVIYGGRVANAHTGAMLRSVSSFLHTIARNSQLKPGKVGSFQRFAWSKCFPKRNVGGLKAIAESEGMTFLQRLDAFLMDDQKVDESEQTYAGAGVYLFISEDGNTNDAVDDEQD